MHIHEKIKLSYRFTRAHCSPKIAAPRKCIESSINYSRDFNLVQDSTDIGVTRKTQKKGQIHTPVSRGRQINLSAIRLFFAEPFPKILSIAKRFYRRSSVSNRRKKRNNERTFC
ncbi:hypothetical protein PUN28_005265 [Cardiocondyla obscurior]|uniref:Uncharacterized protein n=1 Tax=Cardiocondyla obscurior TaxID=286306 RepID=A0AAW2GHU6_9HYME